MKWQHQSLDYPQTRGAAEALDKVLVDLAAPAQGGVIAEMATGVPLPIDNNEALADLPNAARTSFLTEKADRTLAALQAAEARNGEIIARAPGRDT